MTRGGETPPIPPGTTAAQVFADSGCTTRPVAGGEYETLYVRLNRSYSFDGAVDYGSGSGFFEQLSVVTPTSEDPDELYSIYLWADWASAAFDTPFTAGSVIPVSLVDPGEIPSSFTVDFYDE